MNSTVHIKSELGKIEAQLHVLYHKYGISSIKDYLEAEKAKLKRLVGTV